MRRLALLLVLALAWSFAAAPIAVAASVPPASPGRSLSPGVTVQQLSQTLRERERQQERMAVTRAAMQAALARSQAALARSAARSRRQTPSVTLLTSNGDLAHPVDPSQAGQWIRELRTTRPTSQRAATLHLWLGEWELAANEQPGLAQWHFAQAAHLTPRADPLHGLAAYDTALSLYMRGAYEDATAAFHHLLLPQTTLSGYSRPLCALWWRHAASCAGYHSDNARQGIPEPPILDPFCGAASLAASVRALGLPYDRKTLLAACRVSGEGSSLADLKAAGPRLGVHVRSVTATDAGLIALPKPLVAFVEHDHFISVIRADRHGVAYLCSDCGPWPGGEVDLTWRQWHRLNGGIYAAVTRPGSRMDLALDALAGVRVASLPGSGGSLARHQRLASLLPALPALRGVSLRQTGLQYPACSGRFRTLHCLYYVHSPMLSGPGGTGIGPKGGPAPTLKSMVSGPSNGDPVNLATGEEEYEPDPDLTVYNPIGPSVSWGRVYHSLDSNSEPYAISDYGDGWAQAYSAYMFVYGSSNLYLQMPNNAVIYFNAPSSSPTAGHPINCGTTISGAPLLIQYNYGASGDYYSVTFPDRTVWVFGTISGYGQSAYYNVLTKIVDRNGNSINLNYYGAYNQGAWLTSITNSAGTTLLTVNRDPSTELITSVSDCYNRSVYYQEAAYTNTEEDGYELTGVSQVVPAGTANAVTNDGRYVYGYQEIAYYANGPQEAFLNAITVPSPTGSGTSASGISYSASNELVTGLTDANGNTASITYLSGTSTKVTLSGGGASYSATVTYNNEMTQMTQTDGNGHNVSAVTAFDPNDPYEADSVVDGNGRTWNYSYDQYGNELTETPPAVTGERTPATTTNTYSYANFALGELTQTQEGTKTPTSYAYYEPSGLTQTVTGPPPGQAGAAAIVRDSYAYDALGNVTSMTAPGPNSMPAATTSSSGYSTYVTTAYNYTMDGTYSQSDSIGEPLTITDPLGHVSHFRYAETVPYDTSSINRGNTVSVIDAIGNETDSTFNIDGSPVETLYPATGESGSGRGSTDNVYLYDESGDTSGQEQYGPLASVKTYDEGNTTGPLRTVTYAYGLEGETKSVSGSTEPVSYTYDALYRLVSLTDGGGHATRYFYNTAGYLYQTAYPLSGVTTAPATAGTYDTITDTSYDGNGDLLTRVDGNGTTTTYTYADPESLLTDVHYTLPSSPPSYISALADTSYTYDAYGRRQTMTDATGSQSYTYDDDDSALSDQTTYTGLPAETISYTYDPDGSRSSMTTPAGGFAYAYDNAGRETSLSNPGGNQDAWTYLANNWLAGQSVNGGAIVTAYTYDAKGELTDLDNKNSAGTVLADFAVPTSGGYDGAGDRLSVAASLPGTTYGGTTTDNYDGRSELTQEQSSRASGWNYPFQYDGVASGTTTGPGNATTTQNNTSIVYDADNRLNHLGGNTYIINAYDGNGNPYTSHAAYVYDPENRLSGSRGDNGAGTGAASSYGYTGDGLRAWKQNTSVKTYYLYDGQQLVCALSGSGSVTGYCTWGANGVAGWTSGGVSYSYAWDLSGNASERVGSDGSAVYLAANAFGYPANISEYSFVPGLYDPFCGFSGQWGGFSDPETGLTLLTHRYYDWTTARWLTRDPMGYDGGINLYGYCGSDPDDSVDPLGYCLMPFDSHEACIERCDEQQEEDQEKCRNPRLNAFEKALCWTKAEIDHVACLRRCNSNYPPPDDPEPSPNPYFVPWPHKNFPLPWQQPIWGEVPVWELAPL